MGSEQSAIEQIAGFVLELDRLKTVIRKTKIVGGARFENSAEHSWQIALLAMALQPYAAQPVAIDRVVKMLLVHDVGEIDAGDIIVYAQIDAAQREADELAGIERIFGLLPDSGGAAFIELWKEFEAAQTPEARFAHALDRATPVLLHLSNQGVGWRESGISYGRVLRRIRPEIEAGCPALWAYLEKRLAQARTDRWFLAD